MGACAEASALAPRLLSILRLMTGVLFLQHGTQKLLDFPLRVGGVSAPNLLSMSEAAGLFELFGGTLFVIGCFTRPIAFILSGMMAVGYFYAHAPRSLFPALNGGDAAILFCFVFLYFAAAGAGPWSADAALGKRV